METQPKAEPFSEQDFPDVDFSSIDSIRNKAMSYGGAGHGPKITWLQKKLFTHYQLRKLESPASNERSAGLEDAALRKFLRPTRSAGPKEDR